jgi:DNA repair ATPase RecN
MPKMLKSHIMAKEIEKTFIRTGKPHRLSQGFQQCKEGNMDFVTRFEQLVLKTNELQAALDQVTGEKLAQEDTFAAEKDLWEKDRKLLQQKIDNLARDYNRTLNDGPQWMHERLNSLQKENDRLSNVTRERDAAQRRVRELEEQNNKLVNQLVDTRAAAFPGLPLSVTPSVVDVFMAEILKTVPRESRIEQIKRFRERFQTGLKEAKEAIEAWHASQPAPKPSHCTQNF